MFFIIVIVIKNSKIGSSNVSVETFRHDRSAMFFFFIVILN